MSPCHTGAHVAAVLRRLQRLAPSCQYFACSATVRDAAGHASSLLPPSSRQLVVIDDDCSPRGAKQVVVWNPPLKKEKIKRKNWSVIEKNQYYRVQFNCVHISKEDK